MRIELRGKKILESNFGQRLIFALQGDDFQQTVQSLMEMFPYSCALEVTHCLHLMSGDVERTAQLIMHRHENGQDLKPTDRKVIELK